MKQVRIHVFVAGRVQGVGFRYSARIKAKKLGIGGTIQNLDDGRVGAVLEGDKDNVDEMVAWMRKGPMLSKVDEIEILEEDYKGEFKEFN